MIKQYSFLDEGLIRNIIKHNAMCDRAYNLREKVQNDAIRQIRKIKDFYKQNRINKKTYKFLLTQQQNKLARLELRLSNRNLLPVY